MGEAMSRDVLEDDDVTSLENLKFYTGKEAIKTTHGDVIDIFHKKFLGQWEILEDSHDYIQTLFPIRKSGLSNAQPLSKHEASIFRKDKDIRKRIITSFKLMLDFYGFVLTDDVNGDVARNVDEVFNQQIKELNNSRHNFLRISRILKFMGVVGLEHFKYKWLNLLVLETFKSGKLDNAGRSCVQYWIPTLRKKKHVLEMDALVTKLTGKKIVRDGEDRYAWGWGDLVEGTWFSSYYSDEIEGADKEENFKLTENIAQVKTDPHKDVRSAARLPIRRWRWRDDSDDEKEDDKKEDEKKEDEKEEDKDEPMVETEENAVAMAAEPSHSKDAESAL